MSVLNHTVPEPDPGSSHLASLKDALQTERRLLDELVRVMVLQRESIAADDLQAIDESVFSAQRVLRTLQEARRRRRTLLELIGVDRDLPLRELEHRVGPAVSQGLSDSRDALLAAAETLSRELTSNRQVIHGALTIGEQLLRVFTGTAERPILYDQGAESEQGSAAGALLNTRV